MISQNDYLLFEYIRRVRVRIENEPVGNDVIAAYNHMVLGDLVTQAHLPIEKGLKWAILKSGGKLKKREVHSLHSLIQRLENTGGKGQCILKSIRGAFQSVKRFYKIDHGLQGFSHLKTLDAYFDKVGDVYNSARYVEIESQVDPKLLQVWTDMHIEIMRALEEVVIGSWSKNSRTNENVELRVERLFDEAVSQSLREYYIRNGGVDLSSFQNWTTGFDSMVALIGEAVRKNFAFSDDEQFNVILMIAYSNLQNSDDPAVRYRLNTLSYLPKDSVKPLEDVDLSKVLIAVNDRDDYFKINAPSGKGLGFVQRKLDRSWEINMYTNTKFANAWRRDDAIWFLIRNRVWPTQFVVNGESQQHLLVEATPTRGVISGLRVFAQMETCEISFWDQKHGLEVGDSVAFRVIEPIERGNTIAYPQIIVGKVTASEGHEVTLKVDRQPLTTQELDEYLSKYVPDS